MGKHSKTHRKCYVCWETKPLSEFKKNASKPGGRGYLCVTCSRVPKYKRKINNATGYGSHTSEYYRVRTYGFTPQDERQFQQITNCEICGSEFGDGKRTKCVDHCHDTGRIRGVICRACNNGIGLLGDTEDGIKAALEYLQKTEKTPVASSEPGPFP